MKKTILCLIAGVLLLGFMHIPARLNACSTFQFKKGNELLLGHNLNEPGMNVPGMIFINKRGILKHGRSFSELITKEWKNPSSVLWISRYGSVTFNNFGKDFIDGGINEAGLYIWEMNEDADYPVHKKKPRLMHMNWMQYVLDNYMTTEEVIKSASDFQLDGWTWHYFVTDRYGHCASIEFLKGQVIVHQGDEMPVQGLFNMPYSREMELLKYYKGFGGQYEIDFSNPDVTRFVKTAKMLEDYNNEDPTQYCLEMLKKITVYEIPDWSVLIDTKKQMIYFKTNINPELKMFSMKDLDFSNNTPCMILDINTQSGGDVISRFVPYSQKMMGDMIHSLPIPQEFLPKGGITVEDFMNRLNTHQDSALKPENQFFTGIWRSPEIKEKDDVCWEIRLSMKNDAVQGEIIRSGEKIDKLKMSHIYIKDNKMMFTYISAKTGQMVEAVGTIKGDVLHFEPFINDEAYKDYYLKKQ